MTSVGTQPTQSNLFNHQYRVRPTTVDHKRKLPRKIHNEKSNARPNTASTKVNRQKSAVSKKAVATFQMEENGIEQVTQANQGFEEDVNNSECANMMMNSLEFTSSEYDDINQEGGVSDLDDYIEAGDVIDDGQWDTDIEDDIADKTSDFSCEAIYLEACRRQKTIPASYFVRHLKDSEITLKHHGLGAPGIRPVSAALMSSGDVTKLDLSDNWLGSQGASCISRMLKENCFISDLNLSDNRLSTEGCERLKEVLKNNSSLTHLTFQNNKFDDSSAVVWADIIANNLRVEYLDLSHNNFGEDSGKILGAAIAENLSIQELNLSWNNIRRKGAVGIAKGLSTNTGLKKFNIGWNGLSQDGAKAFFKVLKDNECLEQLDMSNNRIATEGAIYIAKGLISNQALKIIKLGMNPMESAGCFSIIKGLQKNPETKLEYIDFSDIIVDKFFQEEYKLFQATFPNIKVRTGSDGIILKPKVKVHPIVKLRNFFDKKNMKLVDFFTKYDKDGSMTVSKTEFREGITDLGIKLSEEESHQLLSELDPEDEGEINYRSVVSLMINVENQKNNGNA